MRECAAKKEKGPTKTDHPARGGRAEVEEGSRTTHGCRMALLPWYLTHFIYAFLSYFDTLLNKISLN